MELLGLAPEEPGPQQQPAAGTDARPISLQVGDSMCYLASSVTNSSATGTSAATSDAGCSSSSSNSGSSGSATAAVAASAEAGLKCAPDAKAEPQAAQQAQPASAAQPQRRPPHSYLYEAVRTALSPPAELRSREYAAFLSARVGPLHLAYASFMCLTGAAFCVLRAADG